MFVLPTAGVQTRGPPGNPDPNFPRSQTRTLGLCTHAHTPLRNMEVGRAGPSVGIPRPQWWRKTWWVPPGPGSQRMCHLLTPSLFYIRTPPLPPNLGIQKTDGKKKGHRCLWRLSPSSSGVCPGCLSSPCTCVGWAWGFHPGYRGSGPLSGQLPLRTPVQGSLFLRQNPHTVFQNQVLNE